VTLHVSSLMMSSNNAFNGFTDYICCSAKTMQLYQDALVSLFHHHPLHPVSWQHLFTMNVILIPLSVLRTELSDTSDTSLTALHIEARTRRESEEKNMWTLIFCGVQWYMGDARSKELIALKQWSTLLRFL